MIAILTLALLVQDPPEKLPAPLYDGAREFAFAIEQATAEDPQFPASIEPFASAFWLWRAEQIKDFDGEWIKQEMILCGKMIELWEPALGQNLRKFALQASLEDPSRDLTALLQSDLRLAYVNRLGRFTGDKDSQAAALFDAGTRLADLTPHLIFAEFVDPADLRTNASLSMKACGKYATDRPRSPAEIRARVSSIGNLAGTIPFTADTMKEAGLRVARALASQVPEKHRWKIPPDPPSPRL